MKPDVELALIDKDGCMYLYNLQKLRFHIKCQIYIAVPVPQKPDAFSSSLQKGGSLIFRRGSFLGIEFEFLSPSTVSTKPVKKFLSQI